MTTRGYQIVVLCGAHSLLWPDIAAAAKLPREMQLGQVVDETRGRSYRFFCDAYMIRCQHAH
jgi:hypothetical protein